MKTTYSQTVNTVIHGDCIDVMKLIEPASIDFVLTDPPYITRYRGRDGRRVHNDDCHDWLAPAFAQTYDLMKPHSFCVSFYSSNKADLFLAAWRTAGFRPVGHIVFRKRYAASTKFLQYRHEMAYLLAKGDPAPPSDPIPDVIDWEYSGNKLHPTQKPVVSLKPIIECFCAPEGIVLDPFCGSGSTLVAAQELGRAFIGIELDRVHCETAFRRTFRLNEIASGRSREDRKSA